MSRRRKYPALPAATRRQLRLPDGSGWMLVDVGRIVDDERTAPRLGRDGQLVQAPRWQLLLGSPLVDGWPSVVDARPFAARDVLASSSTLLHSPSALLVVARPKPEVDCDEHERPASPYISH